MSTRCQKGKYLSVDEKINLIQEEDNSTEKKLLQLINDYEKL